MDFLHLVHVIPLVSFYSLNPLQPGVAYYNPLKHQKTFRFSDVFRGYRKTTPVCNGLKPSKNQKFSEVFTMFRTKSVAWNGLTSLLSWQFQMQSTNAVLQNTYTKNFCKNSAEIFLFVKTQNGTTRLAFLCIICWNSGGLWNTKSSRFVWPLFETFWSNLGKYK